MGQGVFLYRLELRNNASKRRLFYRDFAHEVAHAILNETRPPKTLHFWPTDEDDTHIVALLVEEWVDLDFVQRSQTALDFEQE